MRGHAETVWYLCQNHSEERGKSLQDIIFPWLIRLRPAQCKLCLLVRFWMESHGNRIQMVIESRTADHFMPICGRIYLVSMLHRKKTSKRQPNITKCSHRTCLFHSNAAENTLIHRLPITVYFQSPHVMPMGHGRGSKADYIFRPYLCIFPIGTCLFILVLVQALPNCRCDGPQVVYKDARFTTSDLKDRYGKWKGERFSVILFLCLGMFSVCVAVTLPRARETNGVMSLPKNILKKNKVQQLYLSNLTFGSKWWFLRACFHSLHLPHSLSSSPPDPVKPLNHFSGHAIRLFVSRCDHLFSAAALCFGS